MAATDAVWAPVRGQAFRLYGAIRNVSTNQVITGGLGTLAGTVSKDGAASGATATPVEVGTEGIFYVDLTAANMTADCVVVIVTATASNAEDFVAVLNPMDFTEITGRAEDASVVKFEQIVHQIWQRFFNKMTYNRDTGANSLYQDDGSTAIVSGTNSTSGGVETRGQSS